MAPRRVGTEAERGVSGVWNHELHCDRDPAVIGHPVQHQDQPATHLSQQPQMAGHFQTIMSVGSILILVAMIAILHRYRGRFGLNFESPGDTVALP